MKTLLLVCDFEEFSLPGDFKINIPEILMLEKSYQGMEQLFDFLLANRIKITFFVTEKIAGAFPGLLKKIISQGHEIGFHSMFGQKESKNSDELIARLKSEKEIMERTLGTKIYGFRNHKLFILPSFILREAGFVYDNTCHPTYVPGRYSNFFKSRTIYKENNLIYIPISVTPVFRLPFSWIWFRNFGLNYLEFCTSWALLAQESVNIYFHSWEFIDLSKGFDFKLPYYVTNNTGEKMLKLLSNYLKWCQLKNITTETIHNYLIQKNI